MFAIDQDELQAAFQHIRQAIYNHDQWYRDLIRSIVCRLPYDQRDLAPDAHRQCRFGQWYYSTDVDPLREHAAFLAIESEHRRMHELAARLLRLAQEGVAIPVIEYDQFANALDRLRLQMQTLNHEIEESLYKRDPLTGAESRIGMLTALREYIELMRRNHGQVFSIALMDLDNFKHINDTYGHLAGDQALIDCVHLIKRWSRPYDKIFRYGGEEFLICMPNTGVADAQKMVERLRETMVLELRVNGDRARQEQIRASFGVAELDPDASAEECIDRADKAMYEAKEAGGNCTRLWSAATPV